VACYCSIEVFVNGRSMFTSVVGLMFTTVVGLMFTTVVGLVFTTLRYKVMLILLLSKPPFCGRVDGSSLPG
jgi:hypothetical protein